jgi:Protein of unknown function (DUF3140)
MTTAYISDDLWREFHLEVNMSSTELATWLSEEGSRRHDIATEATDVILDVMSKPREELTEEDAALMESLVGRIRLERSEGLHPAAGEDAWRHRLMALGHDPSKDGE